MNDIKDNEQFEEFLIQVYEKYLLRKPDKKGIEYWMSFLKNKIKTTEEVEEEIKNSEEGTNIRNFSHYSAEFWNHLETVKKYLNKLCTDNENIDFMEDIKIRFTDFLPFEDVLIVGCGNGWVERRLSDLGIAKHFDAFDISEEYLREAIEKKENRNIDYFVDDINELNNIPNRKYDAIFNIAILHHAVKIENAIKKLSNVLKPNGLMFNYEYIGPAQNQYTDEHLAIMEKINSELPKRFQTNHSLRPPLQNFRVEPTEAIHSDLVKPITQKYFEMIFERNLNGGVAYMILWNNIGPYKDPADVEAQEVLKKILDYDLQYTKDEKVPVLFWYSVGIPKLNSVN